MMDPMPKIIVDENRFHLIIKKLTHQILENHENIENLCLIGIQERGVYLAERLHQVFKTIDPLLSYQYGKLDITFYRDDYRIRQSPIKASKTEIEFSINQKNVILVDDVVYTGRTVHAAISALQDLGRPSKIELLSLVDRRFNRHFPIKSNYVGISVDALDEAYVQVQWKEREGQDRIMMFSGKPSKS
ncbi:MAG: bifunctional pyr operon transcriptional regulator/uracil phosphoribosyltransferase PyrR [Saprospiraceae bacterium]